MDLPNDEPNPPTKRGRGRPKKGEVVEKAKKNSNTEHIPPIELEEEPTVSKRGRKRKTINYLDVVNKDNDLPTDLCSTSPKKTTPVKRVKKEKTDEEYIPKKSKSEKNEQVSDSASNIPKVKELAPDLPEKILDENETKNESYKKYNWNGNTTSMVNTLFSNFVKETSELSIPDKIVQTEAPKIKRGRPKKGETPTINISTNDAAFAKVKIVTCAVCQKEIPKQNWLHHKQRFHNNLAWRIGEDALELTNQTLVMSILNTLYKNKKPLYCDKCDQPKKSVLGFLSHIAVCGKSADEFEEAKVKCEICLKRVMPSSMTSHIKALHENPSRYEEVFVPESNYEFENEEGPKGKMTRGAAKQAMQVIDNFNASNLLGDNSKFESHFTNISFISDPSVTEILNQQILDNDLVTCKYPECNFETAIVNDMVKHLEFCINKPIQGYVCKTCLTIKSTVQEIAEHVKNDHKAAINMPVNKRKSNHDYGMANIRYDNRNSFMNSTRKHLKFLVNIPKQKDKIFIRSIPWALEFYEKMESVPVQTDLFKCLKSNWTLTKLDEIASHLPGLEESCDFAFTKVVGFENVLKKEHIFDKLKLFEATISDFGNCTMFCGGPIAALAWLPTPYNKSSTTQILAITTSKNPDDKYISNTTLSEKSLIQFWDFGPLENFNLKPYQPKMAFSITHNHGPVLSLEWCPSNCFDLDETGAESYKRLGVLAASGSDGYVYIYSVPVLPEDTTRTFYDTIPSIKLKAFTKINEDSSFNAKSFHPTKLSWTKAPGHQYMAVGYSNGIIAIFNLFTRSSILRRKDKNGVTILLPYKSFHAHRNIITGLTLSHLSEGNRFLFSTSFDRTSCYWDLNNVTTPITSTKKLPINDGFWLTHWLNDIVGYDESSTSGLINSVLTMTRHFLSEHFTMFNSAASVNTLAENIWLNGILQGNTVGEIVAVFPHQLQQYIDRKNTKFRKYLMGYTSLAEKSKTPFERDREEMEKQKALKNQLTEKKRSKTDTPHADFNPHYNKYEPFTYDEINQKYALIFCDHAMDSFSNFPASLEKELGYISKSFHIFKPNVYPLQSINKIAYNPNRQASLYFATGYQAGFVRVTYFKMFDTDKDIQIDFNNLKNGV